ncbi:MAG: nucleotidyl transferase AbiEii/AbiGii toxin family protein [Sphaerochaeta sp.]|jgi:predicted nucleotidyltransferase component of viral defense system
MKSEIQEMLEAYEIKSSETAIHALKEVIQEIILNSLAQTDFFENAAFYGGTALRIFHGLDRFSEDMDFTLIESQSDFSMDPYLFRIERDLNSYGFTMSASMKEKKSRTAIQSAFLKGNTLEHLVHIFSMQRPVTGAPNNAVLTIKIEIDTSPPKGATYERLYRLLPTPFSALLYDLPSLFAGKVHALLCRKWATREKGRDFYDYVWYLQRHVTLNIAHLEERMRQTNHWTAAETLSESSLHTLLRERFAQVDYQQIQEDVIPFIQDPSKISLYSKEFFVSITDQYLRVQ